MQGGCRPEDIEKVPRLKRHGTLMVTIARKIDKEL
jgi:hypothetical protein